jgi:hypothetical protein
MSSFIAFKDFVAGKLVAGINTLGQQLDPDFRYDLPTLSPVGYLSQYTLKDFIRVVIIIGAYALIVRPFMERSMQKLKDRAEAKGQGPQPIPVEMPAWEKEHDDALDWGSKLRKKARQAQKEREAAHPDDELPESELDKYLD